MEMDYYGLLLATSNDKGTIIRIHSCVDKTLLYECRRGKDKAIINFISFDVDYKYIGVSSERGTIHIWKLNDIIEKNKEYTDNKKEKIVTKNIENDFISIEPAENISNSNENINFVEKFKVKKIKNYKSETSFAKIKINKPKCIFSFNPDDIVVIISSDEKLIFSKIEKKGGSCITTEEKEIKKKD